jgi:hypothetical protein
MVNWIRFEGKRSWPSGGGVTSLNDMKADGKFYKSLCHAHAVCRVTGSKGITFPALVKQDCINSRKLPLHALFTGWKSNRAPLGYKPRMLPLY